jgi:4-aminobutyrate aminotransferase
MTMATAGQLASVWTRLTGLAVERGEGSWVWTPDGDRYLDLTCGIAVTSTGHCHPEVVAAIQRQATRFIHAQVNCYEHDLLQPLADRLTAVLPPGLDTVFLTNSGAEATEAAVKLAKQATGRPNVVVFQGSFHGRTHLTMTMTTSKVAYRAGYAPLPSGIYVAPFARHADDTGAALAAFDALLASQTAPTETAAVVIEPVQGEGGYVPAPAPFLQGLAQRCAEHGILFVADEIQSGMGRTGRWLAVDHAGVVPDVVIMAKGIASGMPLAAVVTSAELAARWPVGSHGGTYGGNPISCAAALATLDVLGAPGVFESVNRLGSHLRQALRAVSSDDPGVVEVRGLGLMVGVEMADPDRVAAVLQHCREESHVLLLPAGSRNEAIRWMPSLLVDEAEIDEGVAAFGAALDATR